MSKRKSKIKVSNKMIGILIGIAITLSAIGVISAMSVSFGHPNSRSYAANGMMGDNMMSGNMMSMMHSMMMNENNGMMGMTECMEIMNQAMSDGEITQAEMEEMMQQMDKDGDGNCDYCGMSIEACRKMISS